MFFVLDDLRLLLTSYFFEILMSSYIIAGSADSTDTAYVYYNRFSVKK